MGDQLCQKLGATSFQLCQLFEDFATPLQVDRIGFQVLKNQIADLEERQCGSQVFDAGTSTQQPAADRQCQLLFRFQGCVVRQTQIVRHAIESIPIQAELDFVNDCFQLVAIFFDGDLLHVLVE